MIVYSWLSLVLNPKTRLIYSLLASPTTFYRPIEKTFYKDHQPLFQEMSQRLNIKFILCLDFEMNKKLSVSFRRFI